MTPNVEFKTLPAFLHHRFCAWHISSCHGRNLLRTIKSVTLSHNFSNSLWNDYQSFCSHSYFSRYNGSSSARFFKHPVWKTLRTLDINTIIGLNISNRWYPCCVSKEMECLGRSNDKILNQQFVIFTPKYNSSGLVSMVDWQRLYGAHELSGTAFGDRSNARPWSRNQRLYQPIVAKTLAAFNWHSLWYENQGVGPIRLAPSRKFRNWVIDYLPIWPSSQEPSFSWNPACDLV